MHSKGVRDFAYCRAYSLFASCSERTVVLWQAQTGKAAGKLLGHGAGIAALAMDDECAAAAVARTAVAAIARATTLL